MDFPADRAGGARKKFWLGLPRSTLQYESHLLSMNAEHPQISLAICSAFSYHFLPSMLCVPAPREVGNGLCRTSAETDAGEE